MVRITDPADGRNDRIHGDEHLTAELEPGEPFLSNAIREVLTVVFAVGQFPPPPRRADFDMLEWLRENFDESALAEIARDALVGMHMDGHRDKVQHALAGHLRAGALIARVARQLMQDAGAECAERR